MKHLVPEPAVASVAGDAVKPAVEVPTGTPAIQAPEVTLASFAIVHAETSPSKLSARIVVEPVCTGVVKYAVGAVLGSVVGPPLESVADM